MSALDPAGDVLLVVDDEEDVRRYLGRLLQNALPHAEILLAKDGREAIGWLSTRSVDLVLTDQRMPGMTGIELLARIAESSRDIPRILLTGFADAVVAQRAVNEGHVHAFYQKPVDARILTDRIQALLEERRLARLRRDAFARTAGSMPGILTEPSQEGRK